MATIQTNLGYSSPPTAEVFSYLKFRATALEGLGNKMQGLSVHNQGLRHYFQSGGGGADFFLYKSHGIGVGGEYATFHIYSAEVQKNALQKLKKMLP